MALRYLSSGESHGPELNIILEGIPANMPLLAEDINPDLKRRQSGYGRGGRMKIEKDQVIFTGGVRHGRTFGGAPVAMKLINKDHQKWLNVMNPARLDLDDPQVKKELEEKFISRARPGHADLAGAMKYDAEDIRDILERSSARETTSRVAVGAVCKKLLEHFSIKIYSHVIRIGEIGLDEEELNQGKIAGTSLDRFEKDFDSFKEKVEASELRCYSDDLSQKMKTHIDEIRKKGDSLGGSIEVYATGVPIGLGSHVQWDERLDAKVAQALMSVHTVKAVEIGLGKGVASTPGSQVHDQIYVDPNYNGDKFRYYRKTNNLGGFEAGMTNGMPLVARVALKPIPTIVSTLDSVDLATKSEAKSHFERSDVCVVPAAGVVMEAMLAFVIAQAFLAKFGGDSMQGLSNNYQNYLEQTNKR